MQERRGVPPVRRVLLLVTGLALALLPLLGVLPGTATRAAADEAPVVETDLFVPGTPEPDGRPVRLDVALLTTDPSVPRPAIVLAHGFGGTKADSIPLGRTLARAGYTVIAYTARGFGASGGLIHLDSPDYEGRDVVRIIDFAAGRPEVEKRGGNPVVGVAGASYGGGAALLAAELDPRVDAVVPAYTWNDLAQALFPQNALSADAGTAPSTAADVPPDDSPGVFKQRWTSLLFLSGLGAGSRTGSSGGSTAGDGGGSAATSSCGRFAPALCADYQKAAASGRPDAALLALLRASGPTGRLSGVRAPTLLIQGEDDTLFGLDQADATFRELPASTLKRMVWTTGGHDAGIDLDGVLDEVTGWFDRYLKDQPGTGGEPDQGFRYTIAQDSLVGRDGDGGRPPEKVSLDRYPGLSGDPVPTRTLALTGGSQPVLAPPGGSPAALTNLPGTGQALAAVASLGGYQLGVLPGQSATFTSAALTSPLRMVGAGRARLQVTSSSSDLTLFVSAWDLGPDRNGRPATAVLPGLAVAPLRLTGLTPGRPTTVEVALPAVVHQVPIGHRVQLVVSTTDQAYAGSRTGATATVGLTGGGVLLPQVGGVAAPTPLDVPIALVVVVAALVLAAAVGLVLLWLRRRAVHPVAELADVPLVVDGLVKTYNPRRGPSRLWGRVSGGSTDAVRAVDGVSLRAEAGQVVGLLGPNGAGKTTVLRMLVGLIRPDGGAIWVNGRPVHAGADVLGEVGAFIEGPGFLPHLTGRQNLAGYWAATGRPEAEAHLEEALEIAGLVAALDRRVRGYSQGMRQRLGIAQAMLGLPDLLLLDEPTNGLDPPQIRAMRQVLRDYAATGRTVVVSSHLLAEVQQTCSDVVVMNRGRVVLTGSMDDLTAGDHVALIGVGPGERDRALALLAARGWTAEPEADDRIRVVAAEDRSVLVAALVEAGIGVDFVDGRQPLEDVFMGLMSPGAAR
ncbi:ABC-2 type transport system ATP-binding protein [Friedmanniella endophytica]|uniref:ABC-2 type transport system ATP-binding protein n=1 Tax=Microlunatus kandeliicorticis TaxID=1759536 RepID=A0A7W3IUV7_9ACTN|nr:alpha/beta fold hydrolase [Microlunatus kandeliicorticis]MBA8795713.1 ABC-2 type transport system ATP-binding protein [Microlunatus kandeliicorticis]